MPKSLLNEVSLIEEVKELEDKVLRAECNSLCDKYRADYCDMRIVECANEVKQLRV